MTWREDPTAWRPLDRVCLAVVLFIVGAIVWTYVAMGGTGSPVP